MQPNPNVAVLFTRVLRGDPVELDEFEKEISLPIMLLDAEMNADVEDIIVEAIMRRSCNPICIHLRLKYGFQPQTTLTRNQLQELSSLPCKVKARELARYQAETGKGADFEQAYWALGAQRNTRILGVFIRLWKRDGKPHYTQFQPRMWGLLERNLAHPALAPVRAWFDVNVPVDKRAAYWAIPRS